MATAVGRDWLTTLWAASYKGVPFHFEEDRSKGGRDNVKHTFPRRDDPYIEDMGRAVRYFSGTAYVHGDDADAQAAALEAALDAYGAGTLVVPYFGPVQVHCDEFERAVQRDKAGYVAFDVKFVRAGATTPNVSVPFLQNIGLLAASSLASTVAALFPTWIATQGEPDHVVAAAADTIAQAAATIDVLRQQYPAAPAASAALRDSVATLIAAVPAAISDAAVPGAAASDLVAGLFQAARDLGQAMPEASAQRAGLALAAAFPSSGQDLGGVPFLTSSGRATVNADAAARAARLAGLAAYAAGVLRSTFESRNDGVTARGEVSERFENELYDTNTGADAALYLAIDGLRFGVVEWLTQTINTLAPVITVESAVIRSSLDLAWILYGDPTRGDELAKRNGVAHPSFMPRTIQALAPPR